MRYVRYFVLTTAAAAAAVAATKQLFQRCTQLKRNR